MRTEDRLRRTLCAVALGFVLGVAQGAGAWQVDLPAERLEVVADGERLAVLAMPEGARICLHWFHSVTGGAVADCFENRAGRLMLVTSYLHDYAAGLGDLPGRGRIAGAPEGGYLITAIDEALPGNRLTLRIGAAHVAQELRGPAGVLPLWRLAPQGARVDLKLEIETDRHLPAEPR